MLRVGDRQIIVFPFDLCVYMYIHVQSKRRERTYLIIFYVLYPHVIRHLCSLQSGVSESLSAVFKSMPWGATRTYLRALAFSGGLSVLLYADTVLALCLSYNLALFRCSLFVCSGLLWSLDAVQGARMLFHVCFVRP